MLKSYYKIRSSAGAGFPEYSFLLLSISMLIVAALAPFSKSVESRLSAKAVLGTTFAKNSYSNDSTTPPGRDGGTDSTDQKKNSFKKPKFDNPDMNSGF